LLNFLLYLSCTIFKNFFTPKVLSFLAIRLVYNTSVYYIKDQALQSKTIFKTIKEKPMLTNTRKISFYKMCVTSFVAFISVFTINNGYALSKSNLATDESGQLALLEPFKIIAGDKPTAIAITPNGKFAYVISALNKVFQYSIDSAGGQLFLERNDISTGKNPVSIAITPNGKFAYVVNLDSHDVSQYGIGDDGVLTPLGTVPTGYLAIQIAIAPNGKFAYITSMGSSTTPNLESPNVSQYSIGDNGQLTLLSSFLTGKNPISGIAIASNSNTAYIANYIKYGLVVPYSIGANGELQAPISSGQSAGGYTTKIAISPNGKYLYSISDTQAPDTDIFNTFLIDNRGDISITQQSYGGMFKASSITMSPNGKYIYITDAEFGVIWEYSIDVGGIPSPLNPDIIQTGETPKAMAITPDNRFAYVVSNAEGAVYQYMIKQ
jgi:6-phosphogluconolactonase (cycloisomerase 2 family)